MRDLIPGLVAALMLTVFLGFYAVRLNSLALWVIIGSVLGMLVVDYVQSVRSGGDKNGTVPPVVRGVTVILSHAASGVHTKPIASPPACRRNIRRDEERSFINPHFDEQLLENGY